MVSVETVDSDMAQITESVFDSMLGMVLTSIESPPQNDCEKLTGLVQITGNWAGAVLIVVTRKLANTIAATMFGSDPDNPDDEEVSDALGEMANMVGGNFKSLLDPPVNLSLPAVTEGVGYRMFIPGSKIISDQYFAFGDDVVRVSVLARE